MTSDAKLFPPLPKWKDRNFRLDEFGHWLRGLWRPSSGPKGVLERPANLLLSYDGTASIAISDVADVALPIYEGRMVDQFDFSDKGWIAGKGRTAEWKEIPWDSKRLSPQYLISYHDYLQSSQAGMMRLTFIGISSATNSRSMVAAFVGKWPSTNVTPILTASSDSIQRLLASTAVLSSFAFDFQLRQRLGSGVVYLNPNLLVERSLPRLEAVGYLWKSSAALCLAHPCFAREWVALAQACGHRYRSIDVAVSEAERLRRRSILDALVAWHYGLSVQDFCWMMRDCDHPVTDSNRDAFSAKLDPKGFWRIAKEREPELRHTVLAQVAFADLQAQGLDAFLAGPNGDGWQIPETLRLADYGLGHDDRAREPQPVAARLGPRFLPWQLEKDAATSWAECEAHATLLDQLWRHARTLTRVPETETADTVTPVTALRENPTKYSAPSPQKELPL
jgi:hypothetical protein